MHVHSEIRVLVASSVLTNAATLLADPRCIKISYHFSFMIKTAKERIPFKNYITSEKSPLSHSLSFPLSLSLSPFRALFRQVITFTFVFSVFFCLSFLSLFLSLFMYHSFLKSIRSLALSHISLTPTLSNTLSVFLSLPLFSYLNISQPLSLYYYIKKLSSLYLFDSLSSLSHNLSLSLFNIII